MKIQSTAAAACALGAVLCHANIAIDTVFVGDAGNAPDPVNNVTVPGIGAVGYDYYIGRTEVTNAQYTAFLNSVAATDTHSLYNTFMDSFGGITRSGVAGAYTYTATQPDQPVNWVSFWDAARFTNWLTNGQPTGLQDLTTTEAGVYNLLGNTNPINSTIQRDQVALAGGGFAVASENEWYKAAYYAGSPTGADGDGYWFFPNQSNTITTAEANFNSGNVFNVTDVGSFNVTSFYGTFDQAGNVSEWTDTIVAGDERRQRGGSYFGTSGTTDNVRSSAVLDLDPVDENIASGFRVISLIPEPSTYAAIFGGLGLVAALLVRIRQRRSGR